MYARTAPSKGTILNKFSELSASKSTKLNAQLALFKTKKAYFLKSCTIKGGNTSDIRILLNANNSF